MSVVQQVFRSRWGFHPCDYPTFRKLKFLNGVYLQAVCRAHAWRRWHRKDPHNRVSRRRIRNDKGQTTGYATPVPLPEPPLCPVFSQRVHEQRYMDKKGQCFPGGFLEEVVRIDDLGIAAAYAAARKPVPDPAAVRPLRLPLEEIDALYRDALAWVERQDVS